MINELYQSFIKDGVHGIERLITQQKFDLSQRNEEGKSLADLAAYYNHEELIDFLAQHQTPLHDCDSYGATPLYWASQQGHIAVVKKLLQHFDLQCNLQTVKNYPPFHGAALKGHIDVLEALCLHFPINFTNKNGCTALHCAANYSQTAVVRFLLEKGADCNMTDNLGHTPLHLASGPEFEKIISLFLTHPNFKFDKNNPNNNTLLHLAVQQMNETVVETLLDQGSDCNAADDDGETLLHRAVCNNHPKMVEILMRHGASANLQNKKGLSPVHQVAQTGNLDVWNALTKDKKLNLKLKDGQDWNPLHWASSKGHLDLVTCFLKHECINYESINTNFLTAQGENALFLASREGHELVVELLMPHNDPNLQNHEGKTPLFFAAEKGDHQMVATLLKHRAIQCNLRTNGLTPLHAATHFSHVKVMMHLLQHPDTDPNARTNEGFTPLLIAAQKNCLEAFKALMNHTHIDQNFIGPMGQTSLYLAALYGCSEIVEYLLKEHPCGPYGGTSLEGISPLHVAAQWGNEKVVQLLLDYSLTCDVNEITLFSDPSMKRSSDHCDHTTALHFAAAKGHLSVVNLLISDPSIQINPCDSNGNTPLHFAVFAFYHLATTSELKISACAIMQNLLRSGANPNLKNNEGKTIWDLIPQEEHSKFHMFVEQQKKTKKSKISTPIHGNLFFRDTTTQSDGAEQEGSPRKRKNQAHDSLENMPNAESSSPEDKEDTSRKRKGDPTQAAASASASDLSSPEPLEKRFRP